MGQYTLSELRSLFRDREHAVELAHSASLFYGLWRKSELKTRAFGGRGDYGRFCQKRLIFCHVAKSAVAC
jgi:hypothetical protein